MGAIMVMATRGYAVVSDHTGLRLLHLTSKKGTQVGTLAVHRTVEQKAEDGAGGCR